MDWEIIKMSTGVRIKNLPEIANNNLIAKFLEPATTEIEKIDIKGTYADIFLSNDDELDAVLMLSGREILGYAVEIQKLKSAEDLEPEILVEDPQTLEFFENNEKIIENDAEVSDLLHQTAQIQNILTEDYPRIEERKTFNAILNSAELRTVLAGSNLKFRIELPQDDGFQVVMDVKIVALVTMITLILLTFSDIFR